MLKLYQTRGDSTLKTWIIIPDLHYPYHDPKFIRLVTKVISLIKPTGGIVQLGDAVDWFQLSRFDKDPARKNTARDDLEMYREQMLKWANLLTPGTEFRQLEGNHENRLTRYIWGKAGDLAQMVSGVSDLLGIRELNKTHRVKFSWHPIAQYHSCIIGTTILHHGHFFNKHTAVTNLERYEQNIITGHTHRLQLAHYGERWSCTLGHGSLEGITSHIPAPTGWQQAIGILTEIRGECSIEIIAVRDGKCVLRGVAI